VFHGRIVFAVTVDYSDEAEPRHYLIAPFGEAVPNSIIARIFQTLRLRFDAYTQHLDISALELSPRDSGKSPSAK
jgi:hypothetical protein